MCLLIKDYELTLLLVDYERAVLHEGVIGWEELRIHKGRMEEMEKEINRRRKEIENLILSTPH